MIKQKFNPFVLMMCSMLCCVSPGSSFAREQRNDNAIIIDIPVIPEISRHVEWLAYPSYLAVILENTGLRLNMSNPMVIRNGTSFKIKDISIEYTGKRGRSYIYRAGIFLSIGSIGKSFTTTVDLDTSALQTGHMQVRVALPFSEYSPQRFIRESVSLKITRFTNPAIQKQLCDYLDGLDEQLVSPGGMQEKIELLMIDFYNRHAVVGNNSTSIVPIAVAPVSLRVVVLSMLAIGCIMLLLKLVTWCRRRKCAE